MKLSKFSHEVRELSDRLNGIERIEGRLDGTIQGDQIRVTVGGSDALILSPTTKSPIGMAILSLIQAHMETRRQAVEARLKELNVKLPEDDGE